MPLYNDIGSEISLANCMKTVNISKKKFHKNYLTPSSYTRIVSYGIFVSSQYFQKGRLEVVYSRRPKLCGC